MWWRILLRLRRRYIILGSQHAQRLNGVFLKQTLCHFDGQA